MPRFNYVLFKHLIPMVKGNRGTKIKDLTQIMVLLSDNVFVYKED